MPQASPEALPSLLPTMLTLGVKHMADYAERRESLVQLLASTRERHPTLPILVAYEGEQDWYEARGASGEEYIRCGAQSGTAGLAAGRNAIIQHVRSEFVMIVDDDVQFHAGTHLGTLVSHLHHDPGLALVAACYHPVECYAHNFVSDGTNVRLDAVAVDLSLAAPIRAQVVHNAFVARTEVLRDLPRQRGRPCRLRVSYSPPGGWYGRRGQGGK